MMTLNYINELLEELENDSQIKVIQTYLYGTTLMINGDIKASTYHSSFQRQLKVVISTPQIDIEEVYYPIYSNDDFKTIHNSMKTLVSNRENFLKDVPDPTLSGKAVWRSYMDFRKTDQYLNIIYQISDSKDKLVVKIRDLKYDLPIQASYYFNFPKQGSDFMKKCYIDRCIRKSLIKLRNGEVL